jgi:uncharacterized protein (TIGR02598 family)
MRSTLFTTPQTRARAFTLPEVAVSVCICATCLLTLLGLMPFGLDTLRDSASRQAETRMIQSITSNYQMTTWFKQDASSGAQQLILQDKTFFFDQTGTELASDSDPTRMYVVQATVITTAPTLTGDTAANSYLRQLRLRFTDRQAYAAALKDNSGQYHERVIWIADLEQTGTALKP